MALVCTAGFKADSLFVGLLLERVNFLWIRSNITSEQRGRVFKQLRIQPPKIDKNASRCFDLRAFVKSKRREVFLPILGSCYTTLDAKLFEDAGREVWQYLG